jgi:hypothetical protein
VTFDQPIRILPRQMGAPGLICALGTIGYDRVDAGAKPGRLLYIKPTLRAAGEPLPYDVFSYARASSAFPHEPTSDQWFSESQFESYRTLGQHLTSQLGADHSFSDVPGFFDAVRQTLTAATAAPGDTPTP